MIFPVSVPLLSLTVLVRIRPWKQEKIYGGMMNHRRHLFILNLFMSRQMSQVLSFIRVGQQVNLKGLFMLAWLLLCITTSMPNIIWIIVLMTFFGVRQMLAGYRCIFEELLDLLRMK